MSRRRRSLRLHLTQESKEGVLSLLFFAIALLLTLSLLESAGGIGEAIDAVLSEALGWERIFLPLAAVMIGYSIARGYFPRPKPRVRVGLAVIIAASFPILAMAPWRAHGYSGALGRRAADAMIASFGPVASAVVALAALVAGLVLATDRSWMALRSLGRALKWVVANIAVVMRRSVAREDAPIEAVEEELYQNPSAGGFLKRSLSSRSRLEREGVLSNAAPLVQLSPKRRGKIQPCFALHLLESESQLPSSGDNARATMIIERTFRNFGIDVEMGEWKVGPTVTQYTLKPAEGVKLSQITALHNDLALALAAHPIRIEAPIPGKSLVGVEVPNERVAVVRLHSILSSDHFQRLMREAHASPLLVALGKDVAGHPWVADLSRMPHLLIAGATGSGKTIMLNSIITSLLYRNAPEELRLVLIDPKRVELPIYNGIPHLVTPAITDVRKTINALRWLIGEMDRRFDELSRTGHRDIRVYNAHEQRAMPYLVVIVDELADLMATAANEVEAGIIRLAQMARAVGIHLILATQRPSVDVITGLIKANITARIAFSVASSIDSRTILDQPGAEKLLGRGDMLFLTSELSKPKRIQGAFISDKEIKTVTEHLKAHGSPSYDETVVERPGEAAWSVGGSHGEDADPLLDEAKQTILKAGKASASLLQRRLKVGYARAARLLDLLEERGIIGPGDGAKPREVLIREGEDDTIREGEEEMSTDAEYGDEEMKR